MVAIDYKYVDYRVEGPIAYVTLNRTDSFNSLNARLSEELARATEECFDPAIRCVVITGAGKSFCPGGDLAYMKEFDSPAEGIAELAFWLNRLVTNIRSLPKPVIAAVNGAAAGAGMSIALSCDLRFGCEKTKFKQAYTSSALVPDVGWTTWVPNIVGWGKANEMLYFDETIGAEEAKQMGLLNRVFPSEEFAAKVEEEAKRLAAGPTAAYAEAKILLNESQFPHAATQAEKERAAMIRAGRTIDGANAIDAFLNKTTPTFIGK